MALCLVLPYSACLTESTENHERTKREVQNKLHEVLAEERAFRAPAEQLQQRQPTDGGWRAV